MEDLRAKLVSFLRESSLRDDAKASATMILTVADSLEKARHGTNATAAPRRLGCCRHLPAALREAKAHSACAELVEAFAAAEPAMRWTQTEWYRKALGDAFMDSYGYVNILGWEPTVWEHPSMLVAFVVIGPGWHYPRHHHEAEEVYFPLGGDTLWGQGEEPATTRAAGSVVHNTPWLPHEMTTRQTPMFGLVLWCSPDGATKTQGGTLCDDTRSKL